MSNVVSKRFFQVDLCRSGICKEDLKIGNYQKLYLHNVVLVCCTEAKSRPACDVLDPCKISTRVTLLGKTPNATPYYNGLYSLFQLALW